MPGLTLPTPEQTCLPNSTYSVPNTASTKSQWRPHTSRSGRSDSPLFARWVRRHHHQQLDAHECSDLRPPTDRKSISSSSNRESALEQQHLHHHPSCRNNDNACHKHTANFSTSAASPSGSSSKRRSETAIPPPLTREEFDALPLAIQRKVRAFSFVCHICHFAVLHAYRPAPSPLAGSLVWA